MILKTTSFEIHDIKLFDIKSYKDDRGVFSEVFLSTLNYPEFQKKYIQENESISNFGVFRGMHFQKKEFSQSKLIRVIKGHALDIICDLRKSSPSFKKIISIKLDVNQILFLPKGIAHGFLSLEDETIFNYKCDNYYNKKYESGFNLFKSKVDIDFPFDLNKIIMSEKDKLLPSIEDSYIYEHL